MVGARPRLQLPLIPGHLGISGGAPGARSGGWTRCRKPRAARAAAEESVRRFTDSSSSPHQPCCTWWMLNLTWDLRYQLSIGGIEKNPGPSETPKTFSLAHFNINSITSGTKHDELEYFVESNNIQIIGLTETKLNDEIHPSLYKLKSFHTPFTRHRNRHGGGVSPYFHTSLAATRLPDLEVGEEEWVWAKAKWKNMTVITCCLYVPPTSGLNAWRNFLTTFLKVF